MAHDEPARQKPLDAQSAGLRTSALVISPYQAHWPAEFERESARILDATKPWIYQAEHIGSTSVPGLCAKPVIDILLAATSLADVDRHGVPRFIACGYVYVEAYNEVMPFRRFFLRDNANHQRTHHLHVVLAGSEFWRTHLLFRDFLRAHPEQARNYGELKKRLAPNFRDANAYGAAKSGFIQHCMTLAETWEAAGRPPAEQ